MAVHDAVCPACGTTLQVTVSATQGGSVEENVGLAVSLSPEEQTAQAFLTAKARAEEAVARATAEAADAARAVLAAEESRAANLAAASKVSAEKVKTAKAVATATKGGD